MQRKVLLRDTVLPNARPDHILNQQDPNSITRPYTRFRTRVKTFDAGSPSFQNDDKCGMIRRMTGHDGRHRLIGRARRVLWALAGLVMGFGATAENGPDFARDVRPVLATYCFPCHGPDARARKADLRLDDRASARSVLEGDSPELIRRIASTDPLDRMPPPEAPKQPDAAEIERLVAWVKAGAAYEKHWAFSPPERPQLPAVLYDGWPRNPIDRFVLARLEEEGLAPSPEADKTTLIRRVSLDLTGLPPTPQEVDAFLADDSDDAYERVVDRLMASPRYGEHMAQGWMPAARYADTDGYQNDRFRYMHHWRDWVIEAYNANLPYDRFVIDQLAGDMLPDATLRQQIATGFNRNHRINSENGSIPEEWLAEYVADRTNTLGTVFMGLTMECARCHDHKYDPVSQREYYELFAYFNRVPEWGVGPNNGNSPPFVPVPASWPDLSPEENRRVTPKPYRLLDVPGRVARPNPGDATTTMVMHEMADPRPTYVLQRGLYDEPDTREELTPGVPDVLRYRDGTEPRNRLELARWLMHPDHPLTGRVAVNRMWQHFFGRGLVDTPENFGVRGSVPIHPALLNWLATEFVRLGWNRKALQKRIVMSAAYRQRSDVSTFLLARDPENRLLARAPRIRLSAQQLRDQALFVSGLLVEKIGGPSVKPYMPDGVWASMTNATYERGDGDDLYRRSLYTYWRRTTPPPMMTGLNAANRDTCIVRTARTNSPLHALTTMNNVVFVEAARKLAERMLESGDTPAEQIAHGLRRVLARAPTGEEVETLEASFAKFNNRYLRRREEAKKLLRVGEAPYATKYDTVYLASMTMVASAILNLDEAIMRN